MCAKYKKIIFPHFGREALFLAAAAILIRAFWRRRAEKVYYLTRQQEWEVSQIT